MEENVALDSKKQKKFAKSIKGIKSLLKKNEGKPHKPAVLAPKDTDETLDKKKRKRKERGLVYLSHIPHGFYEYQMMQYFKQFGMVTNVRVIRSPRTGRSKGFAFVEFREPAVAEIVAETMNNYLMGKRLLKAVIIPPEKQKHHAMRKHWNSVNNPTAERRRKIKKEFNNQKDEAGDLVKAKNLLKTLEKKKKKLSALGINIDFFTPVDVPEALLQKKQVKQEADTKIDNKVKVEDGKQNKNKSKTTKTELNVKKEETKQNATKLIEVKSKKDLKKVQESDKLKQHDKQNKIKDAGLKLPESFIQVQPESGQESDSSVEFDSDEYEKMLENDSDASSGDESEDEDGDESENGVEDGDDNELEDDESSDEELPPLLPIKTKKGKKQREAPPPQPKYAAKPVNDQKEQKKTQIQKPQTQGQMLKKSQPQGQVLKRKNPQIEVSPKKPKFEKQDKKQRNKQFKKKNKAN